MRTALIFLSTLAVILGVFAYFAVFGGSPGTYGINPLPTSARLSTSTIGILASSTSLSSGGTAATGTVPSLTWDDGGATLSIVSVALLDQQLSFTVNIQMAGSPACVPLNLRLVADESGNLQGPDTPSFSFPDSGSCNGAPNATYQNQTVAFTVDPAKFPLLFTTGGAPNIFFEVATTTANGLEVSLPSTSG